MITLRQVEAFYWVGLLNSFAQAADKLNIGQSTISKRIQELETTIGISLFDRDKRSARLTRKGMEMLPLAEELLRLQHRFHETASNTLCVTGTFRIGITELIALTWLPKLIETIKQSYPLIILETEVDLVANLYSKLEERSIDLLLGPRIHGEDRFTTIPLAVVELAWMCSPGFYADHEPLSLARLAEFPILSQPDRSGLQIVLRRHFNRHGVPVKRTLTSNGMTALAALAASGLGFTCLPKIYFSSECEGGRLCIVSTTFRTPGLQYVTVYREDMIDSLNAKIAAMSIAVCDFSLKRKVEILENVN